MLDSSFMVVTKRREKYRAGKCQEELKSKDLKTNLMLMLRELQ